MPLDPPISANLEELEFQFSLLEGLSNNCILGEMMHTSIYDAMCFKLASCLLVKLFLAYGIDFPDLLMQKISCKDIDEWECESLFDFYQTFSFPFVEFCSLFSFDCIQITLRNPDLFNSNLFRNSPLGMREFLKSTLSDFEKDEEADEPELYFNSGYLIRMSDLGTIFHSILQNGTEKEVRLAMRCFQELHLQTAYSYLVEEEADMYLSILFFEEIDSFSGSSMLQVPPVFFFSVLVLILENECLIRKGDL